MMCLMWPRGSQQTGRAASLNGSLIFKLGSSSRLLTFIYNRQTKRLQSIILNICTNILSILIMFSQRLVL